MQKTKGAVATLILGLACGAVWGCAEIIHYCDVIYNPENQSSGRLTALDQVTNIVFDEESCLLTFNPVENAKTYHVEIHGAQPEPKYDYDVDTNSCHVDIAAHFHLGDEIVFTVTARGDHKTTDDSDPSTFCYILVCEHDGT